MKTPGVGTRKSTPSCLRRAAASLSSAAGSFYVPTHCSQVCCLLAHFLFCHSTGRHGGARRNEGGRRRTVCGCGDAAHACGRCRSTIVRMTLQRTIIHRGRRRILYVPRLRTPVRGIMAGWRLLLACSAHLWRVHSRWRGLRPVHSICGWMRKLFYLGTNDGREDAVAERTLRLSTCLQNIVGRRGRCREQKDGGFGGRSMV